MLVQLFAFAFCCAAVSVALMVRQLPDHRKLDAQAVDEFNEQGLHVRDDQPGASARTQSTRCKDPTRKDHWACRRPAPAQAQYDYDPRQEEPELD
jgi:hypothetical protein